MPLSYGVLHATWKVNRLEDGVRDMVATGGETLRCGAREEAARRGVPPGIVFGLHGRRFACPRLRFRVANHRLHSDKIESVPG
jgi:hypothetical protein